MFTILYFTTVRNGCLRFVIKQSVVKRHELSTSPVIVIIKTEQKYSKLDLQLHGLLNKFDAFNYIINILNLRYLN